MTDKSDEAASRVSPAAEELADEAPPEIPDIDSGSVGRLAQAQPVSAPPAPPISESTPPLSRRLAPPPKPRNKSSPGASPSISDALKTDDLARFDMPSQVSLRAPVAPAIAFAPEPVAAPPRPRVETDPARPRTESEPIPAPALRREPENMIVPPRPEPPSSPRRPRPEPEAKGLPTVAEDASVARPELTSEPTVPGLGAPDVQALLSSSGAFPPEESPSLKLQPPPPPPPPPVQEIVPPAPVAETSPLSERESSPPSLPDFEIDPPTPRLSSRPTGPVLAALSPSVDKSSASEPAPVSAPEPITEPKPEVKSAAAPSASPAIPKLTVPEDEVPTPAPQPAVSIAAMRIIAVGAPTREVPPEISVDLDFEEVLTERLTKADEPAPVEEPLSTDVDVDFVPDSGERLDIEELVSEPVLPAVAEAPPQPKQEGSAAKPPPPPPRRPQASSQQLQVSSQQTQAPQSKPAAAKQPTPERGKPRQPWWEDLFNEDFMRANYRLSDEQIRKEVTFIEHSLGVAAGGVVLDLGCGAGHHAVEFASRGYGVVGYDLSLYQLALAADVAQERSQKINFLQGDMREMAFEEMFDGVFCWNTTFGYFEEEKNLAVAQRVFNALRPGGTFLIDVINRDFVARTAPSQIWFEGDSCVCMDDMSVDFITSRLRVKRSIILDDGRTKEANYSVRLYSMHELGKLLHEVGFRVTEASGHPSTPGVFFGPYSPRIIMLAQRP